MKPVELEVGIAKLSWEDTARQMSEAEEDWSVWDSTSADGLRNCPWRKCE
jgi:exonuclease III